ncbi:hypothetical protein BGW42_001308, partial [Actinomortierella wolfii]
DTDDEEKYLGISNIVNQMQTQSQMNPRMALSSSPKMHPFHALISFVFKTIQRQNVVLPSSVPDELSGILREIYTAALKELRQPGPVMAKKDVL